MTARKDEQLFNHIGDTNEMVNMANSTPLKANNMKLYTEEQVRKMLLQDDIFDIDDILDSEMPIELPTDEEIEQEAHMKYPVNLQPNGRTLAGGKYDVDINYSERKGFMQCARWMRNKILNK